jgi:hypothetical protein
MTVPNLGPVFLGGKSVLDMRMTHLTSGISDYVAYDDAFSAGADVVAPENLKVTEASSSNPGDAFYAVGNSKIKWWFGHLVTAPSVGRTFNKGQKMGDVMQTSQGGGSHLHVGMDVRAITNGKCLKYGTYGNGPAYTYYPKTNREQFAFLMGEDDMGYPDWYWDWARWYLSSNREASERPKNAPDDIPQWAWDANEEIIKINNRVGMTKDEEQWVAWYNGGKKGPRPDVPDQIPDFWWSDQKFVLNQVKSSV